MKKLFLFAIVALLLSSCSLINGEYSLNKKISKVKVNNSMIDFKLGYKDWHKTLVFDIKNISGTASKIDVFRAFLQSAEVLTPEKYDRVELAHNGKSVYYISGSYFNTLGKEYKTQNPIYTVRTFPENTCNMDGTKPFGTWEGGIIAVLTKQTEDFNNLHKTWYWDDLINSSRLKDSN